MTNNAEPEDVDDKAVTNSPAPAQGDVPSGDDYAEDPQEIQPGSHPGPLSRRTDGIRRREYRPSADPADRIQRSDRGGVGDSWGRHAHGGGEHSVERISARVTQSYFKGPIPDPQTLKAYGDVDPSYPERLIGQTEKVIDSNIRNAQKYADAETQAIRMGSWTSTVATWVSLVTAFVLALVGVPYWWLILAIPAVTLTPKIINAVHGRDSPDQDE